MPERQDSAAAKSASSRALHQHHPPPTGTTDASPSTDGETQLSQLIQPHASQPAASTNSQATLPQINHMAPEILLNIYQNLHPTAIVCLSVTCKAMHKFFGQPAVLIPGLTTTVSLQDPNQLLVRASVADTYLWQLLETFMEPRLWAGHYGVRKFVHMSVYREARDRYWTLHPQRTYSILDPNPWVRPGGEAVDIEEAVMEMREEIESAQDMQENDNEAPLADFSWAFDSFA